MQVRAGRQAGRTDVADHLALADVLARAHREARHVAIARADVARMAQLDEIAIAARAPRPWAVRVAGTHYSECVTP